MVVRMKLKSDWSLNDILVFIKSLDNCKKNNFTKDAISNPGNLVHLNFGEVHLGTSRGLSDPTGL